MDNMLRCEAVSFGYESIGIGPSERKLVLSMVDFTLNKGEIKYIKGESGGGKSTFLKILNRLLEPSGGKVFYNGIEYNSIDVLALRKKVQLVPQIPFLFTSMTVRENLHFAAPNAKKERVEELASSFNLGKDLLECNGGNLSVGQAQRFCVIRALLMEPDVLLLDEPTAALDLSNRERFLDSFLAIQKREGFSAAWVTHDTLPFQKLDGEILRFEGGRFVV